MSTGIAQSAVPPPASLIAKDVPIRTLRIMHRTRYTYDRPVTFGEHRLMIRPRDGHDMRILESSLSVSPRADVHWAFDAFGNSIALLSFHEAADELSIESELLLRRYGLDEPLARIERYAGLFPARVRPEERIDLAPYPRPSVPAGRGGGGRWLATVLPSPSGGSLQVLDALGTAVHESVHLCAPRESEGVQIPAETIRLGSGTCRDFALLFMEAARGLGFAARFVTGYLHDEASETDGRGHDGRRRDACLGRYLRPRRRLGGVRPHQPDRRQPEPDPGGDDPDAVPGIAGQRNLRARRRQTAAAGGQGQRHPRRMSTP
jgi:transglutaminase-like putative cysteine protease